MVPVSIGILSFRAHDTLRETLCAHRAAGLFSVTDDAFIYFNALCEADRALADEYDVRFYGGEENGGIYGGFRAIAERARHDTVLILENDLRPLPGFDVGAAIESCLADMNEHSIPAFCLRSRAQPGQGGVFRKYARCYGIAKPLSPAVSSYAPTLRDRVEMRLKHGTLKRFKGASIYAETNPETKHPDAVKLLPSGNFLTDSLYRNWSNQSVLVNRRYFLDVVCRRVEEHPDSRTINGCQDIERSMNSLWWRKRRERLGHHATGVFTHQRV